MGNIHDVSELFSSKSAQCSSRFDAALGLFADTKRLYFRTGAGFHNVLDAFPVRECPNSKRVKLAARTVRYMAYFAAIIEWRHNLDWRQLK